ncbi:MAG: metallophosphoesterase [Bacteroidota bacterium]|nr:metallophosphoesterase [Bacteroidota bacterium]
MQKFFLFILLLFIYKIGFSQEDSIQARIILIGDGGQLNYGRQPVVDAARNLIPLDKKTTVLFLGDNLYKTGLPEDFMPGYKAAKSVLDSQVNIAKGTKAKVIFIPGNHDWTDGGINGFDNVKRQQAYINNLGDKNVQFLPSDGCPGPVEYDINDDVVLILYDSQWFIQKGEKPGVESDCAFKTPEEFYSELDDLLSKNTKKLVILAGHHTLKSYGIHGGYFTIKQHIFPFTDYNPNLWIPLPVIGSIYPIARGVFGTPEDLRFPAYANMISAIQKTVRKYNNVIFVGGHEHTLQLIKDSSYYFIVSGAGSKSTRVSNNKKVLYSESSLGFATLEISDHKNVHVDFYTVNKDSVLHSYSHNLFNFTSIETKKDTTTIPQTLPMMHFEDSVTVAVNASYSKVSGIHKIISGKNYRREWAQPVHLKVFRIDREMGGFKIKNLGGGRQTKSLKIIDKDKKEWTLRTVDKDPEGAVPEALKGSIAQSIVQDMISAQSPYGALVIPTLAGAADVVHATPKYYFVPDDPAFGIYRQIFANKICLLEQVNPAEEDTKTKSTQKVIDKLITDSKNHVDQESVLRARLLDMTIGDWDRHFDQWKFGTNDTGTGKLYYPIPKDRDQAFFNSYGLLARAVSIAALPYLQGFKKHYPNIKWFNWEERDFDRIFMNNLDREKWKRIINQFQQDINDSVINNAVKGLPPEIYALDGKTISEKLRRRRDLLTKKGMVYYRFLSREVNIVGSNKDEYFKVYNAGKNLEVKVYKYKNGNDSSTVMYDRIFDPKVTKFINLYGLNGDDIFTVDSNATSKIKLRIIGGIGNDTFNMNGNVRNRIFDYSREKNFIQNGNRTKNEMSTSPYVNRYAITNFKYNIYRLPMINLGYNVEDKLLLGLGFSLKTYGFRKEPYSTYQKFSTLYSFKSKAYQLKYQGEFNQLIHNNDLVVNAEFLNPVLNNFFGYGNTSVYDQSKPLSFNYVRYKYVQGEVLLRKKYFNNLLQFYLGPSYYHYWNKYRDNEGKILSNPSVVGLDSASIYKGKSYAGGKFAIVINNLNSELLPTRGVIWNTELSSMLGTNSNSHPINKLTSDLAVYASLRDPAKVVAVLRVGGGHIFNNNYEYFQTLDLGADNFLRGFRKNRFSGQSVFYQTTELRVKLFESKSYIIPGAVGLIGFNEVGRVWVKGEISHKWHDDFGGGFYYSPYNFALVSASIAHSPENNLFNFSIGTKFNINF